MSNEQAEATITHRKRRAPDAAHRAEALKERIYVIFTVLAVTIAFERDASHASVGGAAFTIAVTVLGTLLAVFVADIIAHMVAHSSLPTRQELARHLHVSFGSLSVIVAPLVILGLCAMDVLELKTGLRTITIALVATLIVVTLIAIRRLTVSAFHKVLVLAIMSALGCAVLVIELAVH
ncbi:hypothetical protein [Arthrobacter psychrolactophilus]